MAERESLSAARNSRGDVVDGVVLAVIFIVAPAALFGWALWRLVFG